MGVALNKERTFAVSRYWIAIWTTGVAFLVTLVASRLIEPGISPIFLLAVMISSWKGGLGPGLLATILSSFASAFAFLPPRFSLDIDQSDMLQLMVFTIAALIIGSLSVAKKQADETREVLLIRAQAARREAEKASRVKDEFLATVSHELRTPLTTIKTLTRVLQRRELSEAERAEYLEDIAAECDREIDLVLNLLDVSRINAGLERLELGPVDPGKVVTSCVKILRGEAERRGHSIAIDIEANLPTVGSESGALRRALCAIGENAVKYTSDEGVINFRVKAVGNEVHICIEDNGPGIPDADVGRIFDRFYRGSNASGLEAAGAVPGIGLGLNLAKTLLQEMNGVIEVSTTVGKGSCFTVKLPVWDKVHGSPDFPERADLYAGPITEQG
jgi:signal transduction histidine kinase